MNNKYEAMFIVRPDLTEEERKSIFNQIHEVVTKNNASVSSGSLWSDKRKLYFVIKKYRDGVYYLLNFEALPLAITDIRHAYHLNENILRVLITKVE